MLHEKLEDDLEQTGAELVDLMLGSTVILDLSTCPGTSYPVRAGPAEDEGWPESNAGGAP